MSNESAFCRCGRQQGMRDICGHTNLGEVPEAEHEGLGGVGYPFSRAHLSQGLDLRGLEGEDDGALLNPRAALERSRECLPAAGVEDEDGTLGVVKCDTLVLRVAVAGRLKRAREWRSRVRGQPTGAVRQRAGHNDLLDLYTRHIRCRCEPGAFRCARPAVMGVKRIRRPLRESGRRGEEGRVLDGVDDMEVRERR
jgi:hypothetical protein